MTIIKDFFGRNKVVSEVPIYGSSRIGEYSGKEKEGYQTFNLRKYELSNHLGNVLAVISDKVNLYSHGLIVNNQIVLDSARATVVSASDYYPGGLVMKGRQFNEKNYRYGFNTQEKVDEISGSGNHTTAMFWEYDTRTGRRWNKDPVTYPWQSSYAVLDNSPIWKTDFLGLFGSRKEARAYRKEHHLKGRVRIDKDGYYSINNSNAHTSTYRDTESGNVVTAALITANRSDSRDVTPYQLGIEWSSGTGAKSRNFRSGDYMVEMYKQHEHYSNAISNVTNTLRNLPINGKLPDYDFSHDLSGIEGIGKYVKDYSTLATAGTAGNLVFTYLGSHSLWIEVTANDIARRTAVVAFTVHNMSTLESATRFPYFGYQKWYHNTIGVFLNTKVAGRTGVASETEQVLQWSETIKY